MTLTSTYFESEPPSDPEDKRQHGYSRDQRADCVQVVVIALIVTPEGFPLSYEVLAGNSSDKTTLKAFLQRIETQYGQARAHWGHGPRGADRKSAQRNAREPAPDLLPGRYAQRAPPVSSRPPCLSRTGQRSARGWKSNWRPKRANSMC